MDYNIIADTALIKTKKIAILAKTKRKKNTCKMKFTLI